MKTLPSLIVAVETVFWIAASLLVRRQVDLAAVGWRLPEPWITLLKIAAVLALIAIAVGLHKLLFRWLARRGWVESEGEE